MKLILHFAILVDAAAAQGFDITIEDAVVSADDDAISILVKEANIEGAFPVKVERSISDLSNEKSGDTAVTTHGVLKSAPGNPIKGKKTPHPVPLPTYAPSSSQSMSFSMLIEEQPTRKPTPKPTKA